MLISFRITQVLALLERFCFAINLNKMVSFYLLIIVKLTKILKDSDIPTRDTLPPDSCKVWGLCKGLCVVRSWVFPWLHVEAVGLLVFTCPMRFSRTEEQDMSFPGPHLLERSLLRVSFH